MKRLIAVMGIGLFMFGALAPAFATTSEVTISDNHFTPASVTVTKGDTVHWSYPTGTSDHSVTARPQQAEKFDSSTNCPPACITPGGEFSWKFTHAGTFTYYCKIHGSPSGQCAMCGTVVVKDTAPVNTPTPTVPPVHTTSPPHHTAAPTTKPTPTVAPKKTPAPTPTHTPAQNATPLPTDDTRGVVTQTGAPLGTPIAFGSTQKSGNGPLIGLGIAIVGIAAGGGLLLWYRLRAR